MSVTERSSDDPVIIEVAPTSPFTDVAWVQEHICELIESHWNVKARVVPAPPEGAVEDRLTPDEAGALLALVLNEGPAMDAESEALVGKLRRLAAGGQ